MLLCLSAVALDESGKLRGGAKNVAVDVPPCGAKGSSNVLPARVRVRPTSALLLMLVSFSFGI